MQIGSQIPNGRKVLSQADIFEKCNDRALDMAIGYHSCPFDCNDIITV